jgi:hypothetical protein
MDEAEALRIRIAKLQRIIQGAVKFRELFGLEMSDGERKNRLLLAELTKDNAWTTGIPHNVRGKSQSRPYGLPKTPRG